MCHGRSGGDSNESIQHLLNFFAVEQFLLGEKDREGKVDFTFFISFCYAFHYEEVSHFDR
jgi:hypothetical protein